MPRRPAGCSSLWLVDVITWHVDAILSPTNIVWLLEVAVICNNNQLLAKFVEYYKFKMPCCCAVGCSNRTESGIRLFRFPRNKTRRDLWATQVQRDNWQPSDCSYLCEVLVFSCHIWFDFNFHIFKVESGKTYLWPGLAFRVRDEVKVSLKRFITLKTNHNPMKFLKVDIGSDGHATLPRFYCWNWEAVSPLSLCDCHF